MHIAQVNVARALEPLDSPLLAGFVAALAPVNALADAAPGFVWRLQTEDGDATAVRIGDDPRVIVNLSVWASLEALWAFVYGGPHVGVMQRRRGWFERPVETHLALWWVPAGTDADRRRGGRAPRRAPAQRARPGCVRLQAPVHAGRPAARPRGASHPAGRLRLSLTASPGTRSRAARTRAATVSGVGAAQGVERVDERADPRRHHEEIPGRIGARVPVGVRRAPRHDHGASGRDVDVPVARSHDERTLEDIPALVVGTVHVERCDVPRRIAAAARILPLRDHDLRVRGRHEAAGQVGREGVVRRHSVEMKTLFSSVLCSSACIPSSLPTPDCL